MKMRTSSQLKVRVKDIIVSVSVKPEFGNPEKHKRAAKTALDRGETHYTQGSGIPELQEAIAEK